MAAFMFIGSMVCLCLGATNFAMVFGIACIGWVLEGIREQLKLLNSSAAQKRRDEWQKNF